MWGRLGLGYTFFSCVGLFEAEREGKEDAVATTGARGNEDASAAVRDDSARNQLAIRASFALHTHGCIDVLKNHDTYCNTL